MRKYREYVATSLVQQYMADHKGMPDGLDERLEYFSKRGYTGSDIQECMIASTSFLGFQKTKQAYRFRKGLTDELMGGGPMDFFLSDLHLPFLDLYLDLSGCGKTIDGFQAIGAYVSVVMDHSIPTICMLGVIRTEETRRQDGYRLVYLSMDGLIHRTIQEQLDRTTGDLSGGPGVHGTDHPVPGLHIQRKTGCPGQGTDHCERQPLSGKKDPGQGTYLGCGLPVHERGQGQKRTGNRYLPVRHPCIPQASHAPGTLAYILDRAGKEGTESGLGLGMPGRERGTYRHGAKIFESTVIRRKFWKTKITHKKRLPLHKSKLWGSTIS